MSESLRQKVPKKAPKDCSGNCWPCLASSSHPASRVLPEPVKRAFHTSDAHATAWIGQAKLATYNLTDLVRLFPRKLAQMAMVIRADYSG